jgi:DNA-directed RNA polymerase specialized sigma subunit
MKDIVEALKALTASIAAVDKETQKTKRAISPAEAKVITQMRKELRSLRKDFIKVCTLPATQVAKIFGISESRVYQIRGE